MLLMCFDLDVDTNLIILGIFTLLHKVSSQSNDYWIQIGHYIAVLEFKMATNLNKVMCLNLGKIAAIMPRFEEMYLC